MALMPSNAVALALYAGALADYAPRARPTIRVRLSPVGTNPRGALARAVVEGWTDMSKAAPNMTNAILLYEALRQGDVTELLDQFPWVASVFAPPTAHIEEVRVTEQVTRTMTVRRAHTASPVVIVDDMAEDELSERATSSASDILAGFDFDP